MSISITIDCLLEIQIQKKNGNSKLHCKIIEK